MTLRQKAISALWRGFGVDLPNAEYGDMANALDEMLDCLAENADETVHVERKGWRTAHRLADVHADELLAVLKDAGLVDAAWKKKGGDANGGEVPRR